MHAFKLSVLVVSTLILASCAAPESGSDALEENGDLKAASSAGIQSSLAALPDAEVLAVSAMGIPTFVVGNLGKLDTATTQLVATSPDFQASLKRISLVFHLAPADLKPVSVASDDLGFRHLKFTQVKSGLRVVGGELVVHVNTDGVIYAANGSARGGMSLSSTPAFDASQASSKALTVSSDVAGARGERTELVYLIDQEGSMSLAYEVEVKGQRRQSGVLVRDLVYVNARTGSLIARHPQIHTALNRSIYTAEGGFDLPGRLVRTETGAPSNDEIVNINHTLLGDISNCYQQLFNRDSFDGAGAQLISTVHYRFSSPNAMWDGAQMVYGEGDGNSTYDNLAKSLDVTGHELTHAVTERTAGLFYDGQSGGLNESMSDVFAAICQAHHTGAVSANTWLLAEDVFTPNIAGDAMRYMSDPAKDRDFWHAPGYVSLDTFADYDNSVDVHFSSGIGNLAFYLATMGGRHPRNRTDVQVRGLGIEKTRQIWYRGLTRYMTSNTTFSGARMAFAQAATDLYGAQDAAAIANAWACVGVGPGAPVEGDAGSSGSADGGVPRDVELKNDVPVDGLSGATWSAAYFKLEVPAGLSSLSFTTSGGTGDVDLYVQRGSKPTRASFTCRSVKSSNVESCTFANPSSGTWFVMLSGYSTYTGVSLKGRYATAPTEVTVLQNGVAVRGINGVSNAKRAFKISVPAGTGTLTIALAPGPDSTGDADLSVRKGSLPSQVSFDCRPYKSDSAETCAFSAPSGDYYIVITGYSEFANVTLKASY